MLEVLAQHYRLVLKQHVDAGRIVVPNKCYGSVLVELIILEERGRLIE